MPVTFAQARGCGYPRAAVLAVVLSILLVVGTGQSRADDALPVRLFGSNETANADISPFPKWTGALSRYESEHQLEDSACSTGPCTLQRWKAFVASLRGKERQQQLEAVNAYVNRTAYETDQARYGMVDYWATPREFLGRSGDCEDYAVAKYLSLRKLGWPTTSLRIVVLNDERRRDLHAVLVAYHNGTAYVLDNLSSEVREHSLIEHYRPIFSISETGWYFHRDWRPSTTVLTVRAPTPTPKVSRVTPMPSAQLRSGLARYSASSGPPALRVDDKYRESLEAFKDVGYRN